MIESFLPLIEGCSLLQPVRIVIPDYDGLAFRPWMIADGFTVGGVFDADDAVSVWRCNCWCCCYLKVVVALNNYINSEAITSSLQPLDDDLSYHFVVSLKYFSFLAECQQCPTITPPSRALLSRSNLLGQTSGSSSRSAIFSSRSSQDAIIGFKYTEPSHLRNTEF
ncbi:hypothetical protein MKW98_004205 [Papaver atlanticum]|uniref:Uncharacterized protein n=1 Tax=Papaver atlanticum TaxID=357466 RepID=A0AAD4T8T3_9MAGN|nr:hypothetical protein MKW98_004205 [Papaver atlanticum]